MPEGLVGLVWGFGPSAYLRDILDLPEGPQEDVDIGVARARPHPPPVRTLALAQAQAPPSLRWLSKHES